MNKKIRAVGAGILAAIWAVLILWTWLKPQDKLSLWERRELAQFPETSMAEILSGKFMTDFESFSLDQFPLRDTFRQMKSLFHYYVLGQKDVGGIYLSQEYLAKQEYPLNEDSLSYGASRFENVYKTYLENTDVNIYTAVIPDKGYYLGEGSGHLTMDYEKLFSQMEQLMPWSAHIDLTQSLSLDAYYKTDTHWRQEMLLPVAQVLCEAMNMTPPQAEEFTANKISDAFYGVYYGQAALPASPDTLTIMESNRLDACQLYNFADNSYSNIYDLTKVDSKDPYDVFLQGPQSLIRIENPNAKTKRELVIFRDSFGSSIAPLLVSEYKTVTLVDIRYIMPSALEKFLTFTNQDVLFLYSTLVLNNANTIK